MIGFSSQLGKAILGRMRLGAVAVSGTTSTNRTITGVARIAGTQTQAIAGVARLAGVVSQTITGTYLIAQEVQPRCPPLVVVKTVPSSYLLEICERKGT